jgi:hypothetical protein
LPIPSDPLPEGIDYLPEQLAEEERGNLKVTKNISSN